MEEDLVISALGGSLCFEWSGLLSGSRPVLRLGLKKAETDNVIFFSMFDCLPVGLVSTDLNSGSVSFHLFPFASFCTNRLTTFLGQSIDL
uniref:Uncharacterized protein n=1 Tax=Triticum urartu TaxID=4572 RepID=A0A8R7JWJ2_TRIUA